MILKNIFAASNILFINLLLSFSASFAQTCDPLTLDSISNPGEYTIGSLTESDGIRNGPDYNGATIYYPTNATPPYSGMVIVPGYFSAQSTIQNWGPFLASHGIVTMTIGTNSIFDYPELRRDALLDALVTLKEENTRAGSPLLGQLDISSLAVGGWSMGGGGAQLAAVADPSIKAVIALCPWLETGTLTPANINHAAPILFFSAENDIVAPPVSHADVHYDYTPLSTSKMLFEIAGGGHQSANDPIGGGEYVGKIAVAWLKNFLVGDACYCPLVLDIPPTASKYLLNVTCAVTCYNSSVSTVTFSPTNVCESGNVTLTISGNLNDATQWSVYTGSCAGTLVGTTSGSSIVVTPSAPTTTYFIRGEGGCVTPGSCGQVTVTVTPLDDPSFSYSNSNYCVNEADPTPSISGLNGGAFSSTPAGLSLNPSSGTIDLSLSTPNNYTATYTTTGTCPNSSNFNVSITAAPNATFSYTGNPYCPLGVVTATFSPGASAGIFSATPAGLVITPISGDVDLTSSTAGTYTVTNTISASGSCDATSANSTIIISPTLTGSVTTTICNSDSIVVNGTSYNAANPIGTEIFNNIGPNNCDSTVIINLNVLAALTGSVTTTICNSDSIDVNGTSYNAANSSGTEVFTNVGPNNCDSTVNVNITVQSAIDVSVTQTNEILTSNQNGAVYQWLDCNNENTMITTETNQEYTATLNGNYAVEVIVGSCIDTSSCIAITIVGIIKNTFRNSIQIYPNPTDGNLSIDLGESYKSITVTMTNLKGELMQSNKYNENQLLNLTLNHPAGIYLLRIESGNEKAVIRLVKE